MAASVVSTLGHHAMHAGDNLVEFASFAEFHAQAVVTREAACTGQHQVARPASPAMVSACAPQATASRVISANPRVMSAAAVLWPRPSPSTTPAAMAMTFLSEPPSSTPTMSSCR